MSTFSAVHTDVWLCRRPFGRNLYPGSYPQGFVTRVKDRYGAPYPSLHLCCGSAYLDGFTNVDINPDVRADVYASMHNLPDEWTDRFAFTLWDPPYGRYWQQKMYGQRHLRLAEAFQEVSRVTQPGGHIGLLYQWPVQIVPKDLVTVAIHAVFAGPQKAVRVFQVWQKAML